MKSFKQFLLEQDARRLGYSQFAKDIKDYVSEVGSAFIEDPLQFSTEFAKGMVTDPDVWHSGLALAGMSPNPLVGVPANLADAALYAAQGKKGMAALAAASAVPGIGLMTGASRARSALVGGEKAAESLAGTLASKNLETEIKAADDVSKIATTAEKSSERAKTPAEIAFEKSKQFNSDPFRRYMYRQQASSIFDIAPAEIEYKPTFHFDRSAEDFQRQMLERGWQVPDIAKATTTNYRQILEPIYGKDTESFIELARRAQERAVRSKEINPESIREVPLADLSKTGLERPINISYGTTSPIDVSKIVAGETEPALLFSPNVKGAFTPSYKGKTSTGELIPDIVINTGSNSSNASLFKFEDLLAHEGKHVADFFGTGKEAQFYKGKLDDILKTTGDESLARREYERLIPQFTKEFEDLQKIDKQKFPSVPDSRFRDIVGDVKIGETSEQLVTKDVTRGLAKELHLAPEEIKRALSNTADVDEKTKQILSTTFVGSPPRQLTPEVISKAIEQQTKNMSDSLISYFTNAELPGQISDAKTLLRRLGYPNVTSNMTTEEASRIAKEVQDKLLKGLIIDPRIRNPREKPTQMIHILNLLHDPRGKKLFDMQVRKNKGSDVNDKIGRMEMA